MLHAAVDVAKTDVAVIQARVYVMDAVWPTIAARSVTDAGRPGAQAIGPSRSE